MRRSLGWIGLSLLAVVAVGCERSPTRTSTAGQPGSPLGPNQTVATDATVRYVSLEGGCWVLDTPQGSYSPTGMPAPYQVNGLQVYVVMRGDTGVASICMMGPLVALDSIRAR